jgi:hypothetical protein
VTPCRESHLKPGIGGVRARRADGLAQSLKRPSPARHVVFRLVKRLLRGGITALKVGRMRFYFGGFAVLLSRRCFAQREDLGILAPDQSFDVRRPAR